MRQNLKHRKPAKAKVKNDIEKTPKVATSPLKNSLILLDNFENIGKQGTSTPRRSGSSKSPSSSGKKRRKNQIEILKSDLSPKFIGINFEGGKKSRYGRQQRYKEPEDFLPTSIACYVRRTPSKLKAVTSPGEQKFVSYESPIEKLIQKNKILANMTNNTLINNDSFVPSETKTLHEDTKKSISNGIIRERTDEYCSDGFKPENIETNDKVVATKLEASSPLGKLQSKMKNKAKTAHELKRNDMSEEANNHEVNNNPILTTVMEKCSVVEPADFDIIDQIKLSSAEIAVRQLNKSPSSHSTDSAKGSSIDIDIECPTVLGEIFWGRINPFPYWPCIVWPDPQGRTLLVGNRTNMTQVKVHVRFFADNGRRGWVTQSNMMLYRGKKDFGSRRNELFNKFGKKHVNSKGLLINDKRAQLWEQAVSEADIVAAEPLENRLAKFEEVLNECRKKVPEKRRKKSMYIEHDLNSFRYGSEGDGDVFSDPGSYVNFNLLNKRENSGFQILKRDRSPTPESPAYEDIDDLKIFVKKRKIDLNISDSTLMTPQMSDIDIDSEILEDEEYKNLWEVLKSYVLLSQNDTIEYYLKENVKQIWYLRKLSKSDNSNGSKKIHSDTNIRRLSYQIKALAKVNANNLSNEGLKQAKLLKRDNKQRQPKSKPIEEVVDDIMKLNKNYLFKNLLREPVCKMCYEPHNLVKCSGVCLSSIHVGCAAKASPLVKQADIHVTGDLDDQLDSTSKEKFYCAECISGGLPKCFVCKKDSESLDEKIKCQINWCGKYFHIHCLKYWPQSKLTKSSAKIERFLCPCHVCHTCVSDDPRSKFLQIDKLKLAKCVKCPATYHLDSFCIPAGTLFLTATHIICPRHGHDDALKKQHVNANWCFICATGGSLICCETCPTAFHIECLKLPQPEGSYICEECETGRMPLYGELVWAKLSNFRWWPAIIIPPPEVPRNLQLIKHNVHEFCVRFFGSHDHTWISRNRVFLYQEGDWGKVNQSKNIDTFYKAGLEEAKKISEIIKLKKHTQNLNVKDKRLAPPPYIKIKSNRAVPPVKLQEIDYSELTACECDSNGSSPCGPNSGCLNRLLLTECHPKICPAGKKCENQMFEKRIYPPLKVNRTSGKGWGLICEIDLVAGQFIIEYVGEVIDNAEFNRRIIQKQEEKDENYYFLTLEKDIMIDAGPKGNLARFMNHSCEPNCETQKWNVHGITRVGLFAIKDIPANNELTFNYNLECIGDQKKICHCGAEKCAGFIGAKYKEPEKIKTKGLPLKKARKRHRRRSNSEKSKSL